MAGRLELGLALSGSPIGVSHRADERRPDGTPVEVWHRQRAFLLDGHLRADLGLGGNVAFALDVPLTLYTTTIRYEDDAGAAVAIAGADVHHRDETLFRLGDVLVGARLGLIAGAWSFSGTLGLRLPTGTIEDNPYTAEASTRPHQHFQAGGGTVDPELTLALEHDFGDVALGAWAFTRLVFYENTRGYEGGDRFGGGVSLATSFGLRAWRFRALCDVAAETSEAWHGVTPDEDGNRGRVDLYLGLAATVRPVPDFDVSLSLRVPVYRDIVGEQLAMPIVIQLELSGRVALWRDDPTPRR